MEQEETEMSEWKMKIPSKSLPTHNGAKEKCCRGN